MQRHYKAAIVTALALATLAWMALDRTHVTLEEPQPVVRSGYIAPDVTFTLMNGKSLLLSSLAGHTVLLHFWASWCAPCREEFPALLQRIAESDGKTVLLAVSGDADKQAMERFLAPHLHAYKMLFDAHRVLVAQDADLTITEGVFQVFQYPETIVIGPDRVMRRKIAGIYKE